MLRVRLTQRQSDELDSIIGELQAQIPEASVTVPSVLLKSVKVTFRSASKTDGTAVWRKYIQTPKNSFYRLGDVMEYKINNTIPKENILMLQELLEEKLVTIKIADDSDSYTPAVNLISNNHSLFLTNHPSIQYDNDEYSRIIVQKSLKQIYEWKSLIEGVLLQEINLIRHSVSWKYKDDLWVVVSDVGLKLTFQDINLVFMFIDSICGLIRYKYPSNGISDRISEAEEFWHLKTDKLESMKVNEIRI